MVLSKVHIASISPQSVTTPKSEIDKVKIISVIVGSTGKGRFSEKPASCILEHLEQRDGVTARLLDLRDYPMPFFDQQMTPATPVVQYFLIR